MRILIIGGTGILGTPLTARAVAQGHCVTIISDGRNGGATPKGVRDHLILDRRNPGALRAAIGSTGTLGWDVIVDLFCYTAEEAADLLEAVGTARSHIIVVSSTVVYDRRNALPLTPEAQPANEMELGFYGTGKLMMEHKFLEAASAGYPVTILRLPHVLGPGCDLGIAPLHNRDPMIITRIQNNQPLILVEEGRISTQIVHSEDVSTVILKVAGNTATFGNVYNCANSDVITALSYFQALADCLDRDLKVIGIPFAAVVASQWGWTLTAYSRVVSMDSLYRDIGFVPHLPLHEAIQSALPSVLGRLPRSDRLSQQWQCLASRIEAGGDALLQLLNTIARSRPRSEVDRRMNLAPLPILPPIRTVSDANQTRQFHSADLLSVR